MNNTNLFELFKAALVGIIGVWLLFQIVIILY